MSARYVLAVITIAAMGLLVPDIGRSQNYPSRPIRLIVPASPGGAADIMSRRMANELSRQMGQQMIVDNRFGAAGIIGAELIARATPDGYTLGYGTITSLAINPSMFAKLPYDAIRDFQPVVTFGFGLNLLAVSPSLPVRSVKELIELARSNPGKLTYATGGGGATNNLCMELFKFMTGTQLVAIQYKAVQQAILDVSSGQVDAICDNPPSILPHVKAGRVRGIAVTTRNRNPAMPELPTLDEAGLPGFELSTWFGFMFPARVPREIVLRMNSEINKALTTPTMKDAFVAVGGSPGGGTPEEFGELIRREIDKWAKVIKAAGIKRQ
jgi:tripartite-type tricarboxylate transporter receptor subunit TctC